MSSHRASILSCVSVCLLLAACGDEPPDGDYVARVGSEILTQQEVADALTILPAGMDTADARQQFIDRWITNVLLAQAAEQKGLRNDPDVKRLLRENERSVLVSAYVGGLYDQDVEEPSASELRTYYQTHREQLRLREPFVRIRYLSNESRDSTEVARAALQTAMRQGTADSVWTELVHSYSALPAESHDFTANYYPESRIFRTTPQLRRYLADLRPGQISPIVEDGDDFHFLQLIDRIPSGSLPELEWVEDELRQRLKVRSRKQMYTRQVQRLRNEALAQDKLEIR